MAIFAAFGVGLYALSWVAAWSKPDLSWDGNAYHIPTINLWYGRGYIHWIQPVYDEGASWRYVINDLFNGYPKGFEALAFLLCRAFGCSNPVNTCNLIFLPLGVLSITAMAECLRVSRPIAWVCGLAFLLVPVNVSQGPTTYVDSALGSCIATACAATLHACSHYLRMRGRATAPWKTLVPLGASLGLAIGIKATGLPLSLLCITAVVFGSVVATLRSGDTLRLSTAHRVLPYLIGVVAMTLVVGGYWYVRDYIYMKNPLYPVELRVAGHVVFPGRPLNEVIAEENNTPALMAHWPDWKRVGYTWLQGIHADGWPRSIRYYDEREGGLGFLWLLAGVPAVVLCVLDSGRSLVRRGLRGTDDANLLFLLLLCVVGPLFVSAPMHWWARYTVWLHAAGLVALSLTLEAFRSSARLWPRLSAAVWAIVIGAVAMGEASYTFAWAAMTPHFVGPLRNPTSLREFFAALTDYDRMYMFPFIQPIGQAALSHPGAVAINMPGPRLGGLMGMISMPLGARKIVFLSEEVAADPVRFRQLREEQKIRYVFWCDKPILPGLAEFTSNERGPRWEYQPDYWYVLDVGPMPSAADANELPADDDAPRASSQGN
ncbi:hypothetical protein LZC95_15495 [Pendulispora brunnea]|uniref:Glycosyltransferase RgtA/B/C/D-like domain-containing protein n=1 Tax=Pendulispora brunnea TaxID=2905690 RepID=A0ABZ2KHT0_9BACT